MNKNLLRKSLFYKLARLTQWAVLVLPMLGGLAMADVEGDLASARDAFKARDVAKLSVLANRLDNTLVAAYPRYWLLALDLDNANVEQVGDFFKRFPDSPLAEKLHADWAKTLADRGAWNAFEAELAQISSPSLELRCYAQQHRFTEQAPAWDATLRGWFYSGAVLPASCVAVFDRLAAAGMMSNADAWTRMRLALRDGRIGKSDQLNAARQANRWLAADEQLSPSSLERVYQNPVAALRPFSTYPAGRTARELALFALYRLAAADTDAASDVLAGWGSGVPEKERQYAWAMIGYQAAFKLQPQALAAFEKAGDTHLTDLQLEWKARIAMREGRWSMVLSAIRAMAEAKQQEPAWRYWRARSLAETEQLDEARALYQGLAAEVNFYGVLASEELGQPMRSVKDVYQASNAEVDAIGKVPGIARAWLLYQMDWRTEANREWAATLRGWDDPKILAASEWARRHDWFDRAIYAAERTKTLTNYSLRYLSPFRSMLRPHADSSKLDESWVYGLIRQESRFIIAAKSVVGAAGLMQLMPSTATWMARKIGLSNYKGQQIHDMDTNLLLGTRYLRYVLDSLGHPVLATAAYNAGPGRARNWLSARPLEGAIYAESIPFDETRDYVKKVMTNAMVYALLLGDPAIPLKKRMGIMPARGAVKDAAPDEK